VKKLAAILLLIAMMFSVSASAQIDVLNVEEPMKLRIALMQGFIQPDSQVERYLEDRYNIEIELVILPGWADGQAKITMLMADESQRPDAIWWWGMAPEYVKWVEAGLLVDITDYMNTYTNIRDYYNKMDNKTLYFASHNDGRTYRIPGDVSEPAFQNLWIRKDWLDNLNLEIPTTMEELVEVMRAFTEDDPDGNGINDTYGLGGDGYDFRSFWPFVQSYGKTHWSRWVLNDDGTVNYGPVMENTKKWLADAADVYAKGYVTPNIVTDTDREEEMAKGGFGVTYGWIAMNNEGAYEGITSFKAANPDAEWIMIDMVAGENGNPQEDPATSAAWCYVGITDVNPDPERTYAIFDEMTNMEPYLYRWYGVEGEHYTIDEDGTYVPIISYTSPENNEQNIGLSLMTSFVNRKDEALIANNPLTLERFAYARDNSRDIAASLVEWKNSAEFTTWLEHGTDIQDEVDAYFWGIIAGTRSLDEWDDFVNTLNALGLQDCVAEANELYAKQGADMEAFFAK
jgi:putative aldouronate transport system substrate-binding protein